MRNFLRNEKLTLVGTIGIDAGLCWIGDPCYIFDSNDPKEWMKNWQIFCERIGVKDTETFDGLGVCTSTGLGDGEYPVYVIEKEDPLWGHRIAGIFVDFMDLYTPEVGD